MRRPAEKTDAFLDLMVNWQSLESEIIKFAEDEASGKRNALEKTMAKVIGLEAQKRCLVQQMIVESVKKEAAHLDPEEVDSLNGFINRLLENEEKELPLAEAALEKSELFIPRYLLSYLIADLRKGNELLRQFADELKSATISTSATSKIYGQGPE